MQSKHFRDKLKYKNRIAIYVVFYMCLRTNVLHSVHIIYIIYIKCIHLF